MSMGVARCALVRNAKRTVKFMGTCVSVDVYDMTVQSVLIQSFANVASF